MKIKTYDKDVFVMYEVSLLYDKQKNEYHLNLKMNALIPTYKKTHSLKYLNKFVNLHFRMIPRSRLIRMTIKKQFKLDYCKRKKGLYLI